MTMKVLAKVMKMYCRRDCFTESHESNSPTAAGINMTGITAMRKLLVSLISFTFIHLSCNAVKRITMPYILAGMGRGIA